MTVDVFNDLSCGPAVVQEHVEPLSPGDVDEGATEGG
jgi:hypothetical protein